MDSLADKPTAAWLPLTPSGVAAFARAPFGRLWLIQIIVGLLVAGTVGWALNACWFPVLTAAVEHLPQTGTLGRGRLQCSGDSVQRLAENRWLSISVDLQHAGEARSPSQLQFEFGQTDLRVYSVFGLAEFRYPLLRPVPFNYPELKPWWGAWAPILLALTVLSTIFALLVSWALLATVYCPVGWLVGFFLNRDLGLPGSWRMAGAALMPGALVMAAAIACYGMGKFDLVRLLAAWVFHMVLGWVFLILGAVAAPKIPDVIPVRENPFKSSVATETKVLPSSTEPTGSNTFEPRRD